MKENNITKEQLLKKALFENEPILFSKKARFISYTTKDTTTILSNIASQPRFSTIRQRYKVKLFLKKILTKMHYEYILYAFTSKTILYIATAHHIAQNELNMQKLTILEYCKKSNDFNDIKEIRIYRDEKYYKQLQAEKKLHQTLKTQFQEEKSYGIFDNNLTNQNLYNKVNKLKEIISKNKLK